jgi:hypothetical protein
LKCCIPACEARTIRESYAFCPPHWEEYGKVYGGKRKDYPAWLIELINSNKREAYADRRNANMMRSLERMIEQGQLDPEGLVPYQGPLRKPKGKKNDKPDRDRAREPKAEGALFQSAVGEPEGISAA